MHGDRACRGLVRGGSPAGVLMLTAAAGVADRADGLELGADDYLGKPFGFGELVARGDAHAGPFSNTVAVTAGRLRRKLGDPPLTGTVPGAGYRL